MSDEIDTSAPERIWAWADENDDKGWSLVPITGTVEGKPDPEYVRADLYEAERQRAERAEAREAKLRVLLQRWVNIATHCSIEEGVCCCGDDMEQHSKPMDCGHSPVDHGQYVAEQTLEETRAALRQDEGGE